MHTTGRWLARAGALVIVLGFFLPGVAVSGTVLDAKGNPAFLSMNDLAHGLAPGYPELYLIPLGTLAIMTLSFLNAADKNQGHVMILGEVAGASAGALGLLIALASFLTKNISDPSANASPTFGIFVLALGYLLAVAGIFIQYFWPLSPMHSMADTPVAPSSKPALPRRTLSHGRARLETVRGVRRGTVIYLQNQHTVGRAPNNKLQLLDPAVSRTHARFKYEEGIWIVQDQRSKTGVLVNGQHVPEARLKSGDRVQIGTTIFIFRV